jgi:hypothetical protein
MKDQGAISGAAVCQAQQLLLPATVGEALRERKDSLHAQLRELELMEASLPASVLAMKREDFHSLRRVF